MPRISADMEFTCCGMVKPALLHCGTFDHAEMNDRNVELLKQKTEYLCDMRDSVRQEQIKELMLGTSQTMEYQRWLNKEREIEDSVNNIVRFNKDKSDCPVFSYGKRPHRDIIDKLDEVTYHLESVPLGNHLASNAPYMATKTLTGPRIGDKSYGQVEMTKNVMQKKKAEMKSESNVNVQAKGKKAAAAPKEMSHSRFSPNLAHGKNLRFTKPENVKFRTLLHGSEAKSPHMATKALTSPKTGSNTIETLEKRKNVNKKSEAETKRKSNVKATTQFIQGSPSSSKSLVQTLTGGGSIVGHKYKMTSGISGDLEVPSETLSSAFTESLSAADQVPLSSIETKSEDETFSSQTDTLPMAESEIQYRFFEIEVGLSANAAGTVETISGGNRRRLPAQEAKFETVRSQFEEEGQIRPSLNVSVKSVEPAVPLAAFRPDPSDITAGEPVIEVPPVNKAETKICHKTEEGQQLLESGLDVRSSIERTVLKILRCMSDVTVSKIGVHGIGGVGKTSVLKALSSYLKTKRNFDLIILVTVSRYWSIRRIQNGVLRQLSICCEDSATDFQVADRIFHSLSGKKFFLLLDDVWDQIDLKAVGIPAPNLKNGCKILMASRKLDVCHAMCVVRVIELTTLSREEAWELFYEQVGSIIDSPDIQPFARSIVKSCSGLPLLIIVTGRALSEENNVSVWEHASRKFSLPTTEIDHSQYVIQQLRFSFDQLKDHETKSCFLYCCLLSEEQEIDVLQFIEYCIQEDLIAGSWTNARKRGHDIIDVLVRNSLLQLNDGGGSFKIHDLIRDLALGILSVTDGSQYLLRSYSRSMKASSPGNSLSSRSIRSAEGSELLAPEAYQFILRAGAGLTEPPLEEEWNQARMIFLMDNKLCTLPARPSCPELLTLFLQRNYQLRVIPMSFFDSMTSLKVLNLSKTRIKSLPRTLFKLENLQILILRDCERLAVLPSEVGSLVCLEVLDLGGTQISELPDEIGELTSLRHLEVSFYGSINNSEYVKLPLELISSGIISRLHLLETLSIVVFPGDQRWYEDVKPVIIEVCNLTELRSLCFHFPETELLELFLQTSIAWNAQCLTEFKFVVGHDVKRITSRVPEHIEFDYSQQSRCLRFVNGENIPDAVLRTLACSTAFYIDHHLDIHSLTNFGVGNINGLNFCIVSECPKIKTVFDSREIPATVFPNLENLSIHHLWNLTHIWEGTFPRGSFAGLRILSVQSCPKLKYIFSSSMVQIFSKLVELAVEDCPAIEEIIHESEITDSGCSTLPSLRKLTLHYLPGLVDIWRIAWPSVEHMSFYNCSKLKNIGMGSSLKDTIMEIKAERSWWDALEWEDTELQLHLQDRFTAISEDDL